MSLLKDYFRWDCFLAQFPQAHLLQSSAWGQVKEKNGWNVYHLIDSGWGAQILVKQWMGIFRFAYIPKGPVGDEELIKQWLHNQESGEENLTIIARLNEICQRERIAFVKVEPDILLHTQRDSKVCPKGFVSGQHAIQPLRTILIDLSGDEAEILARMKQKTRYNIRLAERKGVHVEKSHDIDLFYRMMVITGQRDGFGVHTKDYYEYTYCLFHDRGQCELFVAIYQEAPIAGLMVFAQGERAFYFYGASVDEHREVMAPYLLQWRAILWAKAKGCTVYDMWGIPDYEGSQLEEQFEKRRDGLWGVYRFKRGFGGRVVRYAGPYDFVAFPVLYAFYRLYTKRKNLHS